MNSDAKYLRSSYRVDYYFYPPDHIGYSVGARCCGTP
jgi:hypothetical protein